MLQTGSPEPPAERRRPIGDRRRRTFRALVQGSFAPRRRGPRRDGEMTLAAVDWHHPQWLAVALLVLLFSVADAFLTITLLQRGAHEINPFMAALVHGSGWEFAVVKLALTSGGVISLILLAHLRVFRVRVSHMLYGVLALYTALIAYELWMLEQTLKVS